MDDRTTNANSAGAGAATTANARSGGPFTIGRAIAVTAAASLLVGLLVGPIIANNHAQGADTTTATAPEHTISVTGMGDVTVKPDVADIYLGVSVTSPTAKGARDAAATQMTAVIAAIKALGVADKDITTTNVSLGPVYDYSSSTAKLTGYQFTNTVKATVRDLTKVPDVLDNSVAAGATVVNGVSFRLDNPKTVEAQARSAAMTDARAKADALASAAGVQIKGVASITEVSVSSPVYFAPQADAAKAVGASTPIQSGTTDVTISVTVSYLIG